MMTTMYKATVKIEWIQLDCCFLILKVSSELFEEVPFVPYFGKMEFTQKGLGWRENNLIWTIKSVKNIGSFFFNSHFTMHLIVRYN